MKESDAFAIQAIQAELLLIPSVRKAKLYRAQDALPTEMIYLLVVEDEPQVLALQEIQKFMVTRLKACSFDFSETEAFEKQAAGKQQRNSIEIVTEANLKNDDQWLEIQNWDSFAPELRRQLIRGGYLHDQRSRMSNALLPGLLVVLAAVLAVYFTQRK